MGQRKRGWARMTPWGVLLTWGVGKDPENTHSSFRSSLFYITLYTTFYIDSIFEQPRGLVRLYNRYSTYILDITTKEKLH